MRASGIMSTITISPPPQSIHEIHVKAPATFLHFPRLAPVEQLGIFRSLSHPPADDLAQSGMVDMYRSNHASLHIAKLTL
ncbi:hypothetical protein DPMN_026172 [Dreissena polymorpha]|uniref:Uncharacterized protein n=1 Tax=Dreissena polymorpha TaxID=45954 RepID=A0A9D4RE09_DREPO|nr:hypothetical protein DPMN_026172 [Dreissena polymorpha]